MCDLFDCWVFSFSCFLCQTSDLRSAVELNRCVFICLIFEFLFVVVGFQCQICDLWSPAIELKLIDV